MFFFFKKIHILMMYIPEPRDNCNQNYQQLYIILKLFEEKNNNNKNPVKGGSLPVKLFF